VSRSQGSRTHKVQNSEEILAVSWKACMWHKINNSVICDSENQRRKVFKTPKFKAPKSRRKTCIKVHIILSDVNDIPSQQSRSTRTCGLVRK
jgi:hypothetical protein